MNPIQPFIDRYGALILDGGLATQLETRGQDIGDALWSARLLADDPDVIRQVHADYLRAGADCIIAASYQATIPGFERRGFGAAQARSLIRLAAELAVQERDQYWSQLAASERNERLIPLVAASVGPYAAYRADGSEYTGDYDLDEAGLLDFHRRRWGLLAGGPADILACETIPVYSEACALLRLLQETEGRYAWFSFACRDGEHVVDGTPIGECAAYLTRFEQVAAIGINCTAPRYVSSLIREVRRATDKPIVVYPNSGESYDVGCRTWRGDSVPAEFGDFSTQWHKLGAAAIGGCCRTTPAHIGQIRDRFPRSRPLHAQ